MGRLVERVQVDPSRCGRDGTHEITGRGGGVGRPVEQVGDQALDGHGACGSPVVELGAVAEREAGKERASSGCGGTAEDGDVRGPGSSLQLGEIEMRPVEVEGDRRPINPQPAVSQGGLQDRQRPPERAARGLVVRVGPQDRSELLAGVRPALDREQGQDRQRLARVHHERRTIDANLERPEDTDLECSSVGHRA